MYIITFEKKLRWQTDKSIYIKHIYIYVNMWYAQLESDFNYSIAKGSSYMALVCLLFFKINEILFSDEH